MSLKAKISWIVKTSGPDFEYEFDVKDHPAPHVLLSVMELKDGTPLHCVVNNIAIPNWVFKAVSEVLDE